MGRSNGCEANRKRADAQKRAEKYNKEGNSQKEVNASAMSIVCDKCFQSFMVTQRKMAEQHAEAKHPGIPFTECFPKIEEVIAAGAAKKDAQKHGDKSQKKDGKKK
jgi:hypothetical protein